MSGAVFLDTSGWLAAINPRESRHHEVLTAYEAVLAGNGLAVTTNLVVGEMQILLSRSLGPHVGVTFLDRLRADARHEVVWADAELTWAATDRWLRPFAEHRFSLCDAVSFEVMRQRRVRRALTLDRHFAIAGFQALGA